MIKGEEMGRRAKDKHSILIGGIARVYYDDDTKYERVKVVGCFLDIDDVHLADDSPYFEGCIFDGGHIEGTVRWDKKTFNKFMESFHELF